MTTGQILAQCDTIRELSEKATAGPWEQLSGGSLLSPLHRIVAGHRVLFFREDTYPQVEQDAALIAESRTFAPSAAHALKVAIEALEKIHNAEPNRNWENAAQQARRALQQITEAFEIPLDEQAKH